MWEEGYVSDLQHDVWTCLVKNPLSTDREITSLLGYDDPNKVRPRRKELVNMGLVVEEPKRACTITGRSCYTWKAVNKTTMGEVIEAKKNFVWDKKKELRTFKGKNLLRFVIDILRYFNKYPHDTYDTKFSYAIQQSNSVYEAVVERKRR